MDIHICNLPLVEDYKTVQIKTIWFDAKMDVCLLDENAAWKGTLLFSQLTQLSQTFNLTSEEHLIKCKEALTTNEGVKDFSYHLEDNCFVWKKKILTDMKVKFGQVHVEKVPVSEVRKDIMNTLLSQNKTFKSQVGSCEQEIEKLKSENSELLRTLEEFTDAKVRNERVVYGKFVALINTKKQRIVCLEKLLFKNLCADTEEAKATQAVGRINWDSDTEPEDEDMECEPRPGPSGHCTMEDIECESTDPDTEGEEPPHRKLMDTSMTFNRVTRNNQNFERNRNFPSLNEEPSTSSNSRQNQASTSENLELSASGAKKSKLGSKENVREVNVRVENLREQPGVVFENVREQPGVVLENVRGEPGVVFENKKMQKSVAEMDSQELLDLL